MSGPLIPAPSPRPSPEDERALAHLRGLAEKGLCFEHSDSAHHSEQKQIDMDIAHLRSRLTAYAALKAEVDAANKECDIRRESLRVAQAEVERLRQLHKIEADYNRRRWP